uniref:Uncharacterized protein n=1 Tax=Rhizophora mucronata TaxID=61149 RepID=A0A2P2QG82_RHIMU
MVDSWIFACVLMGNYLQTWIERRGET